MSRKRSIAAVFGVSCLGGAVWLLTAALGTASGQPKVTVVTVTAGKPTELGFKLSKVSMLPTGAITFKVTNKGLGFHDFKVCVAPVKDSSKSTCLGRKTKLLKNNESDTLTVSLTKKGLYEYLCSVTGHARAGMKGLIGVGVKVPATGSGSASGSGSTGGGNTTGGGSNTGGDTGNTNTGGTGSSSDMPSTGNPGVTSARSAMLCARSTFDTGSECTPGVSPGPRTTSGTRASSR